MIFDETQKTAIRDILAAYDALTAAIREASKSQTMCATCYNAVINAARLWTVHSIEDAISWSNQRDEPA